MTLRAPSFALSLSLFALFGALVVSPPRADAQDAADGPDVHVTIVVEAPLAPGAAQLAPDGPPTRGYDPTTDPGRLRHVEPGFVMRSRNVPNAYPHEGQGEDNGGLLLASVVTVGLGLTGVIAAASEVPHYTGEGWPEWAAVVFGVGAEMSALGMLALGGAMGSLMGEDEALAGMMAVAGTEVVFSVVLTAIAIAIAPGVGHAWDDPIAQARTSEMLGAEAFALGITGTLGVLMSIVALEEEAALDPSRNVAIAPMVSPTTAGVAVGGRF